MMGTNSYQEYLQRLCWAFTVGMLGCILHAFCSHSDSLHVIIISLDFVFYWRCNPLWVHILQPSSEAISSSRMRFLDHTQRRATVGRTPLDEWSVRRRDLYLTTHTHNRQTSMPPVGFEPTIRNRRASVDLRLRPCGYWDRQFTLITVRNFIIVVVMLMKGMACFLFLDLQNEVGPSISFSVVLSL